MGNCGKRIKTDPVFRAELELCDQWGIPHSQFLGGDGTWTGLDRIKALEYASWKRQACSRCGTRPSDFEEDRNALVADVTTCRGCELVGLLEQQLDKPQPGTFITLRPIEDVLNE